MFYSISSFFSSCKPTNNLDELTIKQKSAIAADLILSLVAVASLTYAILATNGIELGSLNTVSSTLGADGLKKLMIGAGAFLSVESLASISILCKRIGQKQNIDLSNLKEVKDDENEPIKKELLREKNAFQKELDIKTSQISSSKSAPSSPKKSQDSIFEEEVKIIFTSRPVTEDEVLQEISKNNEFDGLQAEILISAPKVAQEISKQMKQLDQSQEKNEEQEIALAETAVAWAQFETLVTSTMRNDALQLGAQMVPPPPLEEKEKKDQSDLAKLIADRKAKLKPAKPQEKRETDDQKRLRELTLNVMAATERRAKESFKETFGQDWGNEESSVAQHIVSFEENDKLNRPPLEPVPIMKPEEYMASLKKQAEKLKDARSDMIKHLQDRRKQISTSHLTNSGIGQSSLMQTQLSNSQL